MGKNSEKTTAIREQNIRKVLQMAQAPIAFIPPIQDDSLTQAGQSIGKTIKQYREDNLASNARMGGSAGRTEDPYQAQRAGEREDMTQFGDDKEKMGAAMARSLMGSKKFTKGEVRRGYRRLG